MSIKHCLQTAFSAALPVMAGYLAIGVPCGIMEAQIGLSPWLAFVVSMTFYSGAGQFMVGGMQLAGAPAASIIASVSFVNTRQMLYAAAFSPYFAQVRKPLSFFFSATVTDESFGVNLTRFQQGSWTPAQATAVNVLCMFSWAAANALGAVAGDALPIPAAIASFAMTSIFSCLLVSQRHNRITAVVVAVSMLSVCLFKIVGHEGPAILFGACLGVACGLVVRKRVSA